MERIQSLTVRAKDSLLFLYQKLNSTLLGPVIIGVLVFGLFFDFSIIEPSNTAWILGTGGDGVQNYLGSSAFRLDTWHFPITRTILINSPEGVSIVYTDSNPLFSIITKSIKFIFPPHYQFFGFWFLICWILQSVFGYLLIKRLTNNSLYALLSAVLFCLLPTQLARLGHANLVGFWIILWALYIFINKDFSAHKKQWLFFVVFALSALIHAYLLFMVLFIAGSWYVMELFGYIRSSDYRALTKFLVVNASFALALGLLLWVLGYFYNLASITGPAGFGYFSMNLNAPFSATKPEFSKLMGALDYCPGQHEGYQYLGAGFLLLLLFMSLATIQKDKPYLASIGLFYFCFCVLFLLVKQEAIWYEKIAVCLFFIIYGSLAYALYRARQKELLYLYIPATACFIFALSNRITLGKTLLFEATLNYDAFYMFLLQSGRSSGRFFWVTALFLLLAALFLLHHYFGKNNKSIFFLSVIILLQYYDVSLDGFILKSNEREYQSPLDLSSQKQILASRSVKFLTTLDWDLKISEFSLLNNKAVNKFYTARRSGDLTVNRLQNELQNFNNGKYDSRDLYLIESPNDLPLNVAFNVHNFYAGKLSLTPAAYRSTTDTAIWVKHKQSDSLSALIHYIKTSPLVLISVKEASASMPEFFKHQLDSLYKSQMSDITLKNSYIAVFSQGKLVKELLSKNQALEYTGNLLNHGVYIKSAGLEQGDVSIMKIDGVDLSFNMTGLNVLVLESKGDVWDSYNFNTSTGLYPH